MQTEWAQKAHYETASGDRVTLLRLDSEWAISWSYGYPNEGLQLIHFGGAGPEAIDTFVQSRENKKLMYDSREAWQTGSV
jgi:hypothetical protein